MNTENKEEKTINVTKCVTRNSENKYRELYAISNNEGDYLGDLSIDNIVFVRDALSVFIAELAGEAGGWIRFEREKD